MADSVTQLRNPGPVGTKRNLVILGDGFDANDQNAYNAWVQTTVIDGVFGNDYFAEDASAWNIFRINLESVDSGTNVRVWNLMGTPNDSSDDTITSTTTRDTALDMVFNGVWSHCWLEYGANTEARIRAALARWVPDFNFVLVVANNPGFGGCGGNGRAHVSMGVTWDVIAHEFGHGIGGLGDEYCVSGAFTGAEAGLTVNLTANTDRTTLKWRDFVDPATPVPTGIGSCAGYTQGIQPADWDATQSVGLFEGGWTNNTGVYRPALDCRMNSNTPPFCPVCYTTFKRAFDAYTGHAFQTCRAGDFNGDGRSDVLVHSGTGVQVFSSVGDGLELTWSVADEIDGWRFGANDQFLVGDFDGDGRDEIVIFNGTDWSEPSLGLLDDDGGGLRVIARYDNDVPGWGTLAANDRFHVGDFDGDGKDDLYVFNGLDWGKVYVGMLRSDGTGFDGVQRFDGDLPGWGTMAPHDELHIADVTGDGKAGLYVFNSQDWGKVYVAMVRSTGSDLEGIERFDGELPGWGGLGRNDRLFVADFDGDGKDDLYVFNGLDYGIPYLGLVRSTGTGLDGGIRYDGEVPGWAQLGAHDQFFPADIDGTGRVGLYAVNTEDWGAECLGRLPSDGKGLGGEYVTDFVGEWSLSRNDSYEVCSFDGGPGRKGLFAHNHDWFAMITGSPAFALRRVYFRWIHNYRHGRNW